jgi:hypothetical protein
MRPNEMIESIIITEITRLFNRAADPTGLSFEDVRKLEVYCKIYDSHKENDPKKKTAEGAKPNILEILKALKETKPNDEKAGE